jgi:hypothetical protein
VPPDLGQHLGKDVALGLAGALRLPEASHEHGADPQDEGPAQDEHGDRLPQAARHTVDHELVAHPPGKHDGHGHQDEPGHRGPVPVLVQEGDPGDPRQDEPPDERQPPGGENPAA